jgi:hypothetical protein
MSGISLNKENRKSIYGKLLKQKENIFNCIFCFMQSINLILFLYIHLMLQFIKLSSLYFISLCLFCCQSQFITPSLLATHFVSCCSKDKWLSLNKLRWIYIIYNFVLKVKYHSSQRGIKNLRDHSNCIVGEKHWMFCIDSAFENDRIHTYKNLKVWRLRLVN